LIGLGLKPVGMEMKEKISHPLKQMDIKYKVEIFKNIEFLFATNLIPSPKKTSLHLFNTI